ncbi:MAG: hypothetical protein Q7T79_00540 [bacterium]|nr:hypothetical protein [bacterium]
MKFNLEILQNTKLWATIFFSTLGIIILLGIVVNIVEYLGIVKRLGIEHKIETYGLIISIILVAVMAISIVPLFIQAFIATQIKIGNQNLGAVKFIIQNQIKIILFIYSFWLTGLIIIALSFISGHTKLPSLQDEEIVITNEESIIYHDAEFNFKDEKEFADFLDNYYILDSQHKNLADDEGSHGWNKAIRKSDYCLLVVAVAIETHSNKTNLKKPNTEPEKMITTMKAREKSIEDLNFWFDRSEDKIREQLKQYNLDKIEVDGIIKSMNKCKIKSNGTMF